MDYSAANTALWNGVIQLGYIAAAILLCNRLRNRVKCDCGFAVEYTEEGFLSPAEPFETLRQWNLWQRE